MFKELISRFRHTAGLLAVALFLMCVAPPAPAVDAIVLEVRELTLAGIPVQGATVRLDVLSEKKTRVTVSARNAALGDPFGSLTQLLLVCDQPVIAEPRYGCASGTLSGRGGPTGSIDMNVSAQMRTDTGVTTFSGNGFKMIGTSATFNGQMDQKGWQVKGKTGTTTVGALRKFAEPWGKLPPDYTTNGKVALELAASDEGKGTVADVTAKFDDLAFSNAAGDTAGDQVDLTAHLIAHLRDADTGIDLELDGTQGQAIASIVFLDLGKNPLNLKARGVLKGDTLRIDTLHLLQKNLSDISGSGTVNLAPEIPSITGNFQLAKLEFPATYTTYMANILASSMLGNMTTAGSLSGEVSLKDSGIMALHILPNNLELHDNKKTFDLSKVNGEIFWSPEGATQARASKLGWAKGGAYGLSGGAAELQFVAQGAGFALTMPTKLPVLDGALAIDKLAINNAGASNMEVAFKGDVEPISMPLLAKAFGWPEFSGTLAARIPGVALKDNVLTFDGTVESAVFGGRLEGSNIRLQDPLGKYPRFFADVRARDLDLGLITQTFDVGSITGKLEVDVLGLELFDWTPQSFDARLATPKGDKSRHRISAKAVSSLSNAGGGGGGVVQALQSGVLKFFDEYSYDKLGLNCRLRGDVCEMSGIEPTGIGYYIVKGAGLPRIDIVGNAGRVRFSQLIESITHTDLGGATVQ
jgi:hypothetical protein